MRQGNGVPDQQVHANGTVADAIAAVLKREGVRIVFGYPRNAILEAAARIDIRTVIVRQERTGLHMADAVSRMSKGGEMGVFVMQQGPGAENAMGAVAQAFAESVPVLVMPQGYALSQMYVPFNFNSVRSMASYAKHCEPLTSGEDVAAVLRRAFAMLRNGRPQPVVLELPHDMPTGAYPQIRGRLHGGFASCEFTLAAGLDELWADRQQEEAARTVVDRLSAARLLTVSRDPDGARHAMLAHLRTVERNMLGR